jgi:hypothetical protein
MVQSIICNGTRQGTLKPEAWPLPAFRLLSFSDVRCFANIFNTPVADKWSTSRIGLGWQFSQSVCISYTSVSTQRSTSAISLRYLTGFCQY